MQRTHTRSRSFKLKRLWTNSGSGGSSDDKPTTPATPGTFNYYSVNNPGAADAYDAYARRQQQQQQVRQGGVDASHYDDAADAPTFPEERDSDEDSFDDGDEAGQVRRRLNEEDGEAAARRQHIHKRQSAPDRDLPLPTRTPKESKRTKSKDCCVKFCSRFSVPMFLAFCLCFSGGGLFAVCLKLVADEMMQMQQEVFHISRPWMEGAAIGLTAAGAVIMALSALVFALSFIYWPKEGGEGEVAPAEKQWTRTASKTPPLILILLLYPAFVVWLCLVAFSVGFHWCTWVMDGVCNTEEILPLWDGTVEPPDGEHCEIILEGLPGEDCVDCIDLYQFHFLFPPDTRKEDMWICGTEIELFCSDYIPGIVLYWLLCIIGSAVVVFGVSVHLVVLTHERTRLGEERRLREESDLRYIQNRVSHALLTASVGSLDNNNRSAKKKRKKMSKEEKRQQRMRMDEMG